MKRYGNLWCKICTIDNFKQAYKNAIKGKKHYKEVKFIEEYGSEKYLSELLKEVKENKYMVSEYTIFKKETGGKEREIWRLPMKDRIVQHAIMIHIEPIFRKTFIADTYSSIKGRGIHLALKRVKRAIRNSGYKYYLKLDIKKCYPSLDQSILKLKLSRLFKDKKLLNLLYIIIDSCNKGVPIGNYTSQYFNNFYFSKFDHWIKEKMRVKYYFRYCDDMVILGNDKEQLWDLLKDIKNQIDLLNVTLKPNYQLYQIEIKSIDFLGYNIRYFYTKIRKHVKKNFISKICRINLHNITDKNINVLGSYWGMFIHANCRNLWYCYTNSKTFVYIKQTKVNYGK